MTTDCGNCGKQDVTTYDCEHTGSRFLCKECYEELHWLMTNEASQAPDQYSQFGQLRPA